jgi:hypothetical protein
MNPAHPASDSLNAAPVLAEPEPQSDTGRSPTTGEARESNEVLDKGGRLTSCHSRGGVQFGQ